MKKVMTIGLAILVFSSIVTGVAFAKASLSGITTMNEKTAVKTMQYEGYISDVMCGEKGKDPAGINLRKNPEKHTMGCLKMPACEKSGYGIFMKKKMSDKEYTFHKFDKKGSEMAKKEIIDKTMKTEAPKIEVEGTMKAKSKEIVVKSIKEL